ncbi:hypothetical protein AXF42_Ash017108 [Apostasia shenzhenica]|uniref:J domain-containing protein n=1 Tax=Apostasia shenzhenica TaxID=1088818 RepID=A0A2H9ZV63_9ASPA|nr:hypothetical protein AXF42_Ash017108 [Apostasia shenzhenica]
MSQELDEEEANKQLDLLKESYAILSSEEKRRLYDWSFARSESPDRYVWPFERSNLFSDVAGAGGRGTNETGGLLLPCLVLALSCGLSNLEQLMMDCALAFAMDALPFHLFVRISRLALICPSTDDKIASAHLVSRPARSICLIGTTKRAGLHGLPSLNQLVFADVKFGVSERSKNATSLGLNYILVPKTSGLPK